MKKGLGMRLCILGLRPLRIWVLASGLALAPLAVAAPALAFTPGGTSCPGPQVIDPAGDAQDNSPGGTGGQVDSLDLLSMSFSNPDAKTLRVTLTINDLMAPPPVPEATSGGWVGYWTYAGKHYFAEAVSYTGLAAASAAGTGTGIGFYDGFLDSTISSGQGSNLNVQNTSHTDTGTFTWGKKGIVSIDVPLANVGNPPPGARLTNLYAETHVFITATPVRSTYFTDPIDIGPNYYFGADYFVGGVCPAGALNFTSTSPPGQRFVANAAEASGLPVTAAAGTVPGLSLLLFLGAIVLVRLGWARRRKQLPPHAAD